MKESGLSAAPIKEAVSDSVPQGQKKLPSRITIGEKYQPAMEIKHQALADEYFERLVHHNLQCQTEAGESHDVDKAIATERANLGYFAGYYDSETRGRVERLFQCSHPIFGKISEHVPNFSEALDAGREMIEATSVPDASRNI